MSRRSSIFGKLGRSSSSATASIATSNEKDGQHEIDGKLAPPPAYTTVDESATADLTAAFDQLKLADAASDPTVDTCLAHLKLLFAIQSMKEEVGYTDGLWGLWDSLAGPLDQIEKTFADKKKTPSDVKKPLVSQLEGDDEKAAKKTLENLSKIREKRWALFLARAAQRYEVWWNSLPGGQPLTERDMEEDTGFEYLTFPTDDNATFDWTEDKLPPLDVLMVWHTHMLNPRAFLEDAMLAGLRGFWNRGLPWNIINAAIDKDFNYNVTDQCKANWTKQTGLSWDNQSDPLVKELQCPKCAIKLSIPWTTCSKPEDFYDESEPLDLTGTGYGDGNLKHLCESCGVVICKELLCAHKFVKDVEALLGPYNRPIPGTILEPTTGKPAKVPPEPERSIYARTFPNRLLKSGANSIRTKVTTLMTSKPAPTMQDIRAEIEVILTNSSALREINNYRSNRGAAYRVGRSSKLSIRKMMSHYWENFSPFALDLAGAVVRQGIFIEKMYKIDWLHSPSATDTMKRLLLKYVRFFTIMQKNPTKMAVPTLDVDLAWHTHQLSPRKYYEYSIGKCDKFIDHDDKVEEGRLSEQFEWTSKEYQDTYGEVYSECTCWYCECESSSSPPLSNLVALKADHNVLVAIRTSHVNSLGQVLGVSKSEKSMSFPFFPPFPPSSPPPFPHH
ncbi:hypothetical protein B0T20DRAFT_419958 [Sordaria brevicollis]|uniref:Uncharacterized protein n=1 Tax=Sordaria brevicollis TaxID=83679 RepID=A0AAE0P9M3_SORBR|nr:hypothetical protein B0T20DRAFT_419958 [Sordaria brevicollis]